MYPSQGFHFFATPGRYYGIRTRAFSQWEMFPPKGAAWKDILFIGNDQLLVWERAPESTLLFILSRATANFSRSLGWFDIFLDSDHVDFWSPELDKLV